LSNLRQGRNGSYRFRPIFQKASDGSWLGWPNTGVGVPEGNKKSLGNLPRLVKMEQVPAPEPLEGVEPPAIPCAIAKVPPHKTIRGR
jgi:hypothetical protein